VSDVRDVPELLQSILHTGKDAASVGHATGVAALRRTSLK
jgi:hypothetical protein